MEIIKVSKLDVELRKTNELKFVLAKEIERHLVKHNVTTGARGGSKVSVLTLDLDLDLDLTGVSTAVKTGL